MIGAWTLTGGLEPAPPPPTPHGREIAELIGLLPQQYRLTLWLHLGGWSQQRIAIAQGLGQATVSERLARVRAWLRLCAPIRAELRSEPLGVRNPGDSAVWNAVVRLHEPLWRVAARTGWSQRALWGRWSWLRTANPGLPRAVGGRFWAVPGPMAAKLPKKTG